MLDQIVRGPLLLPRDVGLVTLHADGVLAADAAGILRFAGPWAALAPSLPPDAAVRASEGVMLPPLVDIHTHVSQHPVRGHFTDGVPAGAAAGRLLEGLRRNVYPAEMRCADSSVARDVARTFLADTLAHGVVGGVSYMTSSVAATEAALDVLPDTWRVGLVLMDRDCPPQLSTDTTRLEEDVTRLVARYGQRLIITDRFAVATTSTLRRRGVALAHQLGLRTQTHLNEQRAEKARVEQTLHPEAASYADVYRRDGLLAHRCILAHCVHMTADEWRILRDTGSVVAHCPTSNLLLGSGRMPLDDVLDHDIDYALATDVGASPTVSMLAEMGRFLQVHAANPRATPVEALYRATAAPARIADLADRLGELAVGRPMSFIEVEATPPVQAMTADNLILALMPQDMDQPALTVTRVTMDGRVRYQRNRQPS